MWFYDQKLPFRDRPLFSRLDALLVILDCAQDTFDVLTQDCTLKFLGRLVMYFLEIRHVFIFLVLD